MGETTSGALRLYELTGAHDEVRFSPYCWRIRLALAHKGLAAETVPWRFTEKNAIAFSGQGRVPVLVDGARSVHDSWAIAEYLEAGYPDRPSLFGGAAGHGVARFVNQWTNEVLHPAISRAIVFDLPAIIHAKDRDYFRTSREAAYGTTFEAMAAGREDALAALRRAPPHAAPAAQHARGAALPGRGGAGLRRPHRLRRLPVGAHRHRDGDGRGGRPGGRMVRADAGRLRRPRAGRPTGDRRLTATALTQGDLLPMM